MESARTGDTLPVTRALLVVAGTLVVIVGIPLSIWTEQTDVGFAWTINPPMTAAFLGASYWAAAVLEFAAARERAWANARIAVPAVLLFAILTLLVTLVHIDRFHFGSDQPIALIITWGWIVVYAAFPVLLGTALALELRRPRPTPPRISPVAGWFRVLLLVQGLAFLVPGVVLLVAPEVISPLWPWELTALTGRAIGAWFVGLSVVPFQMLRADDWRQFRPAVLSSATFVVLQAVAILRFGAVADWTRPLGVLLLAIIASMAVVAIHGAPRAFTADAPAPSGSRAGAGA